MSVKKKAEVGSDKASYLHGQRKTVIPPGSEQYGFCCDESGVLNVQVNTIGDYSKILSIIEHLVAEGISNFFTAPANTAIITEYMAQQTGQKKPQRSRVTRDISNNEIIRPRDLTQATGLSKTNIWRLEKEGKFVTKLRLSNGCVGYLRTDVQEWLANRQTIKGE